MKLPPLHAFKDAALAQTAFTHKSFGAPHNERMEWLGDAILQFGVSRLLYQHFPDVAEGGLSQIRSSLVSRRALAELAERLQFSGYARLGKAQMRGGRRNENLLANIMEAYLAAVYLDGGDVLALLDSLLADDIRRLAAQIKQDGIASVSDNHKSRLQEWLQQRGYPTPAYQLLAQQGKSDEPVFKVECRTEAGARAEARGRTRAAAEQTAAAACLQQLAAAAAAAAAESPPA